MPASRKHTSADRFRASDLEALDRAKILAVRSGKDHKFTAVWVVVVDGRVFVRSWNDKPTGWYRAFRAEPRGALSVGDTEIAIRGVPVRSDRIRKAVTAAYAAKYNTKGSLRWFEGFADPEREANTLELVPA
jgi:hypothetical protein